MLEDEQNQGKPPVPPHSFEGQCACGEVRYRVSSPPLIVHGCHCTLCQIQTGTAFAINALVEENRVALLRGTLQQHHLSTPSGKGQTITRCGACGVALWSKYHAMGRIGEEVLFIRVGTTACPDALPPDVHIYTSSKLHHVPLPAGAAVFEGFYKLRSVWSAQSLARYDEIAAGQARAAPPAAG